MSTLNPNAKIFIPQKMSNIILLPLTEYDKEQISTLDKWTQVSLDSLWRENIYDTIVKDELEKDLD